MAETVRIGGRELALRSGDSPRRMQRVAEYVERALEDERALGSAQDECERALCAALRLLARTSVGHESGGRSLLGGVGKYAGAFDFRLAEKIAQLFKLRLALAGETRDERRAQHKTRNPLA